MEHRRSLWIGLMLLISALLAACGGAPAATAPTSAPAAGNLLKVFGNSIHEPSYLSGLIAGKLTKSNKIGVVAAMPIPEVNRIVNGFIQGAKETNPNSEVRVSYINSFFDPAAAKEAALAHVAAGA